MPLAISTAECPLAQRSRQPRRASFAQKVFQDDRVTFGVLNGIRPHLFPAPRAGSRSRTSNTNSEPSAAVANSCASSGPMRRRLMAPAAQRASWNSGPSGSLYERSAPASVPTNRHLPPARRQSRGYRVRE